MVLNRACRREADSRLSALRKQITLQMFTHRFEDAECRETRQLTQELAEVSSRISVEINEATESGDLLRKYRVDSLPALVVCAKAVPELRIYGLPLVYAFTVLLDSICTAGMPGEAKENLCELLSEPDSVDKYDSSKHSTLHLELLCSRRDSALIEAAAALLRVVYAEYQTSDSPKICASIRILENELSCALSNNDKKLPVLLLNGKAGLDWPFSDHDICTAFLNSL